MRHKGDTSDSKGTKRSQKDAKSEPQNFVSMLTKFGVPKRTPKVRHKGNRSDSKGTKRSQKDARSEPQNFVSMLLWKLHTSSWPFGMHHKDEFESI